MYKEIAKLIMYRDDEEISPLYKLGDIFYRFDTDEEISNNAAKAKVYIDEIYAQIKAILKIATDFGFNENLWHN